MSARSYGDPCGIARAMDAVGGRWALLVVRELILGPKRFADLQRGLSGMSPNVLSQRLKELEHNGVLYRFTAGPPVSSTVYALTEHGQHLEPVLQALSRWGSQLPVSQSGSLSPDALVLSLRTTFDSGRAKDLRVVINMSLGSDQFIVRVANGTLDVARGAHDRPDLTVRSGSDTMRSLLYGSGDDLDSAIRDGAIHVDGPLLKLKKVLRCFTRPRSSPTT